MNRNEYEKLRAEYLEATKRMSYLDPEREDYQAILKGGADILPYLFEDMRDPDRYGHWLHAIRTILGDWPVFPREIGTTAKRLEYCLDWAEEKGYLKFDQLRPYRFSVLSYSTNYLDIGADRVAMGLLFEPLDHGEGEFYLSENSARMERLWPDTFDPDQYQNMVSSLYEGLDIEIQLDHVPTFEERTQKDIVLGRGRVLTWSKVQQGFHPDLSERFETLKEQYLE